MYILSVYLCVCLPVFCVSVSLSVVCLQFYWLNINVGYDGSVYLTIVLNGLIHTIMYTYYFVSLHTKEIWWKSALTMSQMVQFVIMNVQAVSIIYNNCSQYPRNITIAYGWYILSLLFLFAHFFVTSYLTTSKKSKRHSAGTVNGHANTHGHDKKSK